MGLGSVPTKSSSPARRALKHSSNWTTDRKPTVMVGAAVKPTGLSHFHKWSNGQFKLTLIDACLLQLPGICGSVDLFGTFSLFMLTWLWTRIQAKTARFFVRQMNSKQWEGICLLSSCLPSHLICLIASHLCQSVNWSDRRADGQSTACITRSDERHWLDSWSCPTHWNCPRPSLSCAPIR